MTVNYATRVGHHCGDIRLVNDLDFYGLVSGTVTVPPRKRFRLHGKIAGDLVVQKNALVAIHGMVAGAIRNHGGHVMVSGVAASAKDCAPRSGLEAGAGCITLNGRGMKMPALAAAQKTDKRKKAGWASWIAADVQPDAPAQSLRHFGVKHTDCCACRPSAKKLP